MGDQSFWSSSVNATRKGHSTLILFSSSFLQHNPKGYPLLDASHEDVSSTETFKKCHMWYTYLYQTLISNDNSSYRLTTVYSRGTHRMGTTLLMSSGISLVLLVIGILFGIGAFQAWRRWSNLIQHLVLIEACITDLEARQMAPPNSGTGYFVTYSYDYEGHSYVVEESINKKRYSTWKQDMSVTIRIASNEPGDASLVAEASLLGDTALIWGFALAGLFCFGCIFLVFWIV